MNQTTTTGAPANAQLILRPVTEIDPRTLLDENQLALASRNALPVVARETGRGDSLGMAAGVTVALLLGGVTFWSMSGHRTKPVAAPAPMTAPAPRAAAPIMPPPMAMPQPPTTYVPSAAITPVPSLPMQATNDHRKSPAMVFDASPAQSPLLMVAPPAPGDAPRKPGTMTAQGQGDNEQFAARVGGEDGNPATAVAMTNPATTVTQGTLIPAVLETAINTDLPGYVRAMVSRDVKSFDGSTVLIPRSSRLIGQYKSGLAAGQTRAYIIWQRLIRPDGASVALGSPGVDFAGQAGMAGQVDSHFMKRFGSAMLLSVVGGLGAVGSGGASVVLSSGGQSAASVAASRDAQIAPTVRVRQGEPIRIFTARDLDFSGLKG